MLTPAHAQQPSLIRTGWLAGLAVQVVPVALGALTLAACVIRAGGLPAVQGTMGRDEARLALAARAILEHGLPILPGGFFYTRGLFPALVEALTFALLGVSDHTARLPSLVAGTLLVPAVFVFARDLVGRVPALVPAAIVAVSPPLVLYSREAWLYPWFVLWFVLALTWLQRSYLRPGGHLRLYAGLAFVAAIFSHEFALLFVPIAALSDLVQWRRTRHLSWRQLGGFWAIVIGTSVLIGVLSLILRAPTVGGATVEIRGYLRPTLALTGLVATLRMFAAVHPWLIPAAVLGLGVFLHRRAASDRASPSLVFVALALLLAFEGFVLNRRAYPRDMFMVIPLLAVAATIGAYQVGPWIVRSLLVARLPERVWPMLGAALLLAVTVVNMNPGRIQRDLRAGDVSWTWFQAVADRAPGDLIMSYGPTATNHYLGHTDFWLRPGGYEKYVWAGPPPYREVHSGALTIRNQRELEALVLGPHAGRRMWVILSVPPLEEGSDVLDEMFATLASRTVEARRPEDGRLVLLVQL